MAKLWTLTQLSVRDNTSLMEVAETFQETESQLGIPLVLSSIRTFSTLRV